MRHRNDAIENRMLRQKEVAAQLGKSVRTIERWREDGVGPPFVRIGGSILYSSAALAEYLRKLGNQAA